MRHCPKCGLRFDDPAKICRSCGAILEEFEEEATTSVAIASAESQRVIKEVVNEPPTKSNDWTCPVCGERVPGTFELCWNCEGQQEEEVESQAAETDLDQAPQATPAPPPRCLVCGSDRVVPEAHVADQGQHSSGTLCVVVYGNPDALMVKDRLCGECTAVVCGDCGHVQLRVANHGELYKHYLQSQSRVD